MNYEFSVLMSIYIKEKEEYFRQCMESILNQTLSPNEIVIVKDGPITDGLQKAICDYQEKFPSLIKVVDLKKNLGLGLALSLGVIECKNELIARMDTDDICVPERFEKQINMFKSIPDLDICGSYIKEFDTIPDNVLSIRRVPLDDRSIKKYQRRRDSFNHMTVMFKKKAVLKAGNYQHALLMEDSLLWVNMMKNHAICANIDDYLVFVRTGKDMFERRGGWDYFKKYYSGRKKIYQTGYISKADYIYTLTVQFVVAVVPNNVRKFIYTKMLRNPVVINEKPNEGNGNKNIS